MNCPNCGAKLPDGATFCSQCGHNLSENVTGNDQTVTSPVAGVSPEEKVRAKQELKQTQAAYKEARRKAGKTNTPKIVAAVVVVLAIAAGSAFATWYIMDQQVQGLQSQINSLAAASSSETASSTAAAASTAASTTASSTAAATTSAASTSDSSSTSWMVGTWTGTLQSSNGTRCFGGQSKPLVVTIKSVDSTGKVKADIKVCYHAHAKPDNSIDSSDGDAYLEFKDVTLNSEGDFSYDADVSSYGTRCSLKIDLNSSSGSRLSATVDSQYVANSSTASYTDTFTLAKSS